MVKVVLLDVDAVGIIAIKPVHVINAKKVMIIMVATEMLMMVILLGVELALFHEIGMIPLLVGIIVAVRNINDGTYQIQTMSVDVQIKIKMWVVQRMDIIGLGGTMTMDKVVLLDVDAAGIIVIERMHVISVKMVMMATVVIEMPMMVILPSVELARFLAIGMIPVLVGIIAAVQNANIETYQIQTMLVVVPIKTKMLLVQATD